VRRKDVRATVRLDHLDPRHPDPLGNAQRGFVLGIGDSNDPWHGKIAESRCEASCETEPTIHLPVRANTET
jgi:hypothetical protein